MSKDELEKIKKALWIAMGCALEVSPCAEESCKQGQVEWIDATQRTAKEALLIVETKLKELNNV